MTLRFGKMVFKFSDFGDHAMLAVVWQSFVCSFFMVTDDILIILNLRRIWINPKLSCEDSVIIGVSCFMLFPFQFSQFQSLQL